MKKFYVLITTTTRVEKMIDAETEEQAKEIATEMVNKGEIDLLDTLDIDTEITIYK